MRKVSSVANPAASCEGGAGVKVAGARPATVVEMGGTVLKQASSRSAGETRECMSASTTLPRSDVDNAGNLEDNPVVSAACVWLRATRHSAPSVKEDDKRSGRLPATYSLHSARKEAYAAVVGVVVGRTDLRREGGAITNSAAAADADSFSLGSKLGPPPPNKGGAGAGAAADPSNEAPPRPSAPPAAALGGLAKVKRETKKLKFEVSQAAKALRRAARHEIVLHLRLLVNDTRFPIAQNW